MVSRICYFLAGVRFQTRYLLDNFQFIDVALLRDGLWESLYYFHMQPPLLNALLGVYGQSVSGQLPGSVSWIVHRWRDSRRACCSIA